MAMSALEVMTDTESVLKSLKRHLEQLRDSDEIDHKTSTIKQLKGKNVKNIVKDSCSVVEVALKLCEQIMTNGTTNAAVQTSLDRLHPFIKNSIGHGLIPAELWAMIVGHVVAKVIVWEVAEVKVIKKAIRIISDVEKHYSDPVKCLTEELLSRWLSKQAGLANMVSLSSFLEWSPVARSLVAANLHGVTATVASGLQAISRVTNWTVDNQAFAATLTKVCVQLMQFFPEPLAVAVWQVPRTTATDLQVPLQDVVTSLLQLLRVRGVPYESVFLAGTAVAFLLSLSPDASQATLVFSDILQTTTSECDISSLSIGTMDIEVADLVTRGSSDRHCLLGRLSLINGILSCGSTDILRGHVAQMEDTSLFLQLFHNLIDLCHSGQEYHAFRILALWFNKAKSMLKIWNETPEHKVPNPETPELQSNVQYTRILLFEQDSPVTKSSLDIVMGNLDSPVEGVNSVVMDIFDSLIKLHTEESSMYGKTGKAFVEGILADVHQMSWQVRGKHCLMATLLRHVEVSEFLHVHTALFPHLLEAMARNYLVSPATELYRAVLQQMKKQMSNPEKLSSLFVKYCQRHVIAGLVCQNSLVRQNVIQHWLPMTFNLLPRSYEQLKQVFEESRELCPSRALHARIALHRTARSCNMLKHLSLDEVRQSLCHPDDDLRLDGYLLTCVSNKKAEALSISEMCVLRECLPHSTNVDSAPFRQQLQACLRNLLVRARDSCLAKLKLQRSAASPPEEVLQMIDFVDFFWKLSVSCLTPGGSFQRLKTGLEWMRVVMETFCYDANRRQRKGVIPETVTGLLTLSHERACLDFYQADVVHMLICCLTHGTDEIRDLAADILLQYFPWPLAGLTSSDTLCQWMESSLVMCNSAKAHECQGGALVLKMVFVKHVLEHGEVFHLYKDDGGFHVTVKDTADEPGGVVYLRDLVTLLHEGCLQTSRSNPLLAAQQATGHGLLQALQHCLCHPGWTGAKSSPAMMEVVSSLVTCLTDILDLALGMLGGNVHQGDTAPSFEQMSEAISMAIAASGVEADHKGDTGLSAQHQLIMTCCWINIREISILFGRLVESLCNQQCQVLTLEQLDHMGSIMIRVLTRCRHRGAIEGCGVGFCQFCTQLLRCQQPELHSIPGKLLQKVLDEVASAGSTASVTRRSAGLPLIVQSIIAGESKTKQSTLLQHAVTSLLDTLAQPIPEDADQQRDLPQVHALNILKAVFREACVAMATMPYLAAAVIQAIEGFGSPYWGIRNGAMQLLGVLVQRMLGQRSSKEDSPNCITTHEFFTHYPELQTFLLSQLHSATSSHQSNSALHPSLFPVLTLLARLSAGLPSTEECLSEFQSSVQSLSNNPIHAVRVLAAKALVPLVAQTEMKAMLQNLLDRLPSNADDGHQSYDQLHGTLLQISTLLHAISCDLVWDTLWQSLLSKQWLASQKNRCHLVRGTYLRVIMEMRLKAHQELPGELRGMLLEETMKIMRCEQVQVIHVGEDQYIQPLLSLTFQMKMTDDAYTAMVISGLECKHVDVTLATLAYLKERLQEPERGSCQESWESVQACLVSLICDQRRPWSALCEALQLILDIWHRHKVFTMTRQLSVVWQCLMGYVSREANSQIAALSLTVSALVLRQSAHSLSNLDHWSSLLLEGCGPYKSEKLRHGVAQALCLAGANVLQVSKDGGWECPFTRAISIFECVRQLLVDDQPYIRITAAEFIQMLAQQDDKIPISSPVALQVLHQLWRDQIAHHEGLMSYVVSSFMPEKKISEVLAEELNCITEDLFEAEDVHEFQETIVQHRLLLTMFPPAADASVLPSDTTCIRDHLLEMTSDLRATVDMLQDHCRDAGPLNLSAHVVVLTGLHGYLCLCATTQLRSLASSTLREQAIEELVDIMKALVKVPYLHPALRTLAAQALDTWMTDS